MKPVWLLTYEGRDVTDELSPLVLSAEYTDHLSGTSDELRLTVDNRDGRWLRGWWPSAGDRIRCQMGLVGAPLLDTGEFRVAECEVRGAPDTVTINALATPMTAPYRTVRSRAFESTTLATLVRALADELELDLVGSLPELPLERVTQDSETTLAFFRRLALGYGYAFSVRPPRLVFYSIRELEVSPNAYWVPRTGIRSGWSLKGGVQDLYAACELSWLDPATKSLQLARVDAEQVRAPVVLGSGAVAALALPTRTLRQGDRGDDVRAWQTFLASRGGYTAALDGIFGAGTAGATRQFQAAAGIGVDGVVGAETRRAAVEYGYLDLPATAATTSSGSRVLRLTERVESAAQAEALARAALEDANRLRATGTIPLVAGNRRAVAGNRIWLDGFGRFDGPYLIQASKHRVSRSGGYICEAEVSCV